MFVIPDDITPNLYVEDSHAESQVIVDIPRINSIVDKGAPIERLYDTKNCDFDLWMENISGYGALTKIGIDTLELAGHNSYVGPTKIKHGKLIVSGSLTYDVHIENSGMISGCGTTNSLKVEKGGTVSPGKSVGTLSVVNDKIFEKV